MHFIPIFPLKCKMLPGAGTGAFRDIASPATVEDPSINYSNKDGMSFTAGTVVVVVVWRRMTRCAFPNCDVPRLWASTVCADFIDPTPQHWWRNTVACGCVTYHHHPVVLGRMGWRCDGRWNRDIIFNRQMPVKSECELWSGLWFTARVVWSEGLTY